MRGHEAFRLVIEEQPRALALRQRRAVDQHRVVRRHVERRRGDDAAVDADPALPDPLLGIAARAEPRPRHQLGDAIAGLLRLRRFRFDLAPAEIPLRLALAIVAAPAKRRTPLVAALAPLIGAFALRMLAPGVTGACDVILARTRRARPLALGRSSRSREKRGRSPPGLASRGLPPNGLSPRGLSPRGRSSRLKSRRGGRSPSRLNSRRGGRSPSLRNELRCASPRGRSARASPPRSSLALKSRFGRSSRLNSRRGGRSPSRLKSRRGGRSPSLRNGGRRRIAARTAIGALAATLVPVAEIALRPILAVELATRRTIAVTLEVTARRTVPILAERGTRRIAAGTAFGALAAAFGTIAKVALRPIVAVELATRGPLAILAKAALALAVRALLAKALGRRLRLSPKRFAAGRSARPSPRACAVPILAKRTASARLARLEAAADPCRNRHRPGRRRAPPASAARRRATFAGRPPVASVIVAGHGKSRDHAGWGMI